MEKSGVYGDNLEIVAFARCYSVNVKIYQREFAYQISCSDVEAESSAARLLHIAYHSWEHYSSVRNVDGPHSGMPNVTPKAMTAEGQKKQKEALEKGVMIMPWMEKVVTASLPGYVEKEKIRAMLEKCKGDVNLTVSRLLDDIQGEEERIANGDAYGKEGGGDKVEQEVAGMAKTSADKSGETIKSEKEAQNKGSEEPISGKQQAKPQGRPKKETARERKERQKRENMERKKAKATGSNSGNSKAESLAATNPAGEGIRTLHV